jgi:uracil-DNA glycosylase
MRVSGIGPQRAQIMVIGETPDYDEDRLGRPFVGASGHELTKMLSDAGMRREDCYMTNAIKVHPPGNDLSLWISDKKKQPWDDAVFYLGKWVKPFIVTDIAELFAEIDRINPKVILVLSNTALWALTDNEGIDKWRGSQLLTALDRPLQRPYNVIPTYSASAILRKWDWRQIAVIDMMRAHREVTNPNREKRVTESVIGPDYATVGAYFADIEARLAVGPVDLVIDLEIKRQAILCVGLALSRDKAFCLPFWHEAHPLALNRPVGDKETALQILAIIDNPKKIKPLVVRYWPFEEEIAITERLRAILCHHNTRLINQNLGFDLQFIWSYWACTPRAYFDTMIAQHVMLPGTPKSLDYLHSLYGDEYLYWKDDGKFWTDNAKMNYPVLWAYNCKDCLTTFEIYEKQQLSIDKVGLRPQFEFQMRKLNHFALSMFRGIPINDSMRTPLLLELIKLIEFLRYEVSYMAGRELNPNSPKQLAEFFYRDLKQPVIIGKTGTPTCNDEALKVIGLREPLLEPVTSRLNLIRSYNTSITICRAKSNRWTKRWHTSYNTGGTETFRCSSTQNVWDEAMNVQNLTKGKEIGK